MDVYEGIQRGSTAYRRAVVAMLAAGLATFNALYCTQAMLPTLTTELGITPTQSALTISATTGMLAVCIVPASILSERFGRGRVLIISALATVIVGMLLPFAPGIEALIALRALQGALIAGVPAVAMTWLSEEIRPRDLGRAMGIYIAGNAVGGLTGRIIPAGLLEITDWRGALLGTSLSALTFAVVMAVTLPAQKRFTPKQIRIRREFAAMGAHWRNPRLALLFITAFLIMGTFVSLYNYLGFRMIDTFGLSEALVGAVFIMYLSGSWSSARVSVLREHIGTGRTMVTMAVIMIIGALLIATDSLTLTILGLFAVTAAFFALHSTASGWIGIIATGDRAEASSMYLFCYYVGSSLLGWVSGFVFSHAPWTLFIGWLLLLLLVTLAISVALARLDRGRRTIGSTTSPPSHSAARG
ncbi:MFS transporter [Corynebacterium pacaense]|uniref:MFS transporter n=1 Tax=Corynebacterium pacaense TaxID=1816684 RepID=UPI0009BA5984|nr:MFS transporter [Corynebacterium pacaense]